MSNIELKITPGTMVLSKGGPWPRIVLCLGLYKVGNVHCASYVVFYYDGRIKFTVVEDTSWRSVNNSYENWLRYSERYVVVQP